MNSIQSIKDANREQGVGFIRIEIEREEDLLSDADAPIRGFVITDNGEGLNDANFDSFNTAYSDYKERIGGKGLGRFTWLKAFERAEIESSFNPDNEGLFCRNFIFDENYDPDSGNPIASQRGQVGTVVRLAGFREPYRSQFPKNVEQLIQRLIEHFLLIFLEPGCPKITIEDQGRKYSANEVFDKEFKTAATKHQFSIKGFDFVLHGFKLATPRQSHHKLVYSANQRGVVSDYLRDYIPNLTSRLPDGDGGTFVYLGILQSPYLTQRVNPARTDFDFGTEDAEIEPDLLETEIIRRADIRNAALEFVKLDLSDVIDELNKDKEERVRDYVHKEAPQYKVLLKYIPDFIDSVSPSATRGEIEATLHRELFQRETEMKQEGARIIKEATKVDDHEDYYRRFTTFVKNYTDLGTAALAQYVVHRRIILDFLQRAIEENPVTGKYPLERVVHELVFPMQSTSDETPYSEQNLWIVDERLTFHSFIASDKRLSAMREHIESSSAKRGDIVIFDEKVVFGDGAHPINSIVTVEFKKPGRDNYTSGDNPVTQSFELVDAIRTGNFKINGRRVSVSNEKIPATAYCICDLTPSLRKVLEDLDAFATPDNEGYYGFHRRYGIFYEVIDYNKLLRDARQRNRIFFEKLGIVGGW